MVFPVVEARATGATSAVDTTSHAVTLPSGVIPGDLLLVTFSVDEAPTVTGSAGWTKLDTAANSTVVTGNIWFKFATGSDALTLTTGTGQQSSHVSLRISNAGVPRSLSANGSSTNSNPPNENPGFAEDWLWIATRSGDSTTVATVAPTNFSQLQTQAAAGTSGASSNTAERSVNATSQDPGTFTSGNEQWVSFTVSIPPARRTRQAVIDNFDDNSLNLSFWTDFGGAQTVETSQQMQITTTTSAAYYGINTDAAPRSNVGVWWGSNLVNAGNQALTSLEVYPAQSIFTAGVDQGVFIIATNTLIAHTKVASAGTTRASTAYATWMTYFATGLTPTGNFEWLYGPDGVNWRPLFVLANPWSGAPTTAYGELTAGTFGAEASGTTVIFDNYSYWYIAPPANASSWPARFKASYR